MQFSLVPGHQAPDAETVVSVNERFVVVRKDENLRHVVDPAPGGS